MKIYVLKKKFPQRDSGDSILSVFWTDLQIVSVKHEDPRLKKNPFHHHSFNEETCLKLKRKKKKGIGWQNLSSTVVKLKY